MKTFIFLIVLLLCANGFPICSNRVKRARDDSDDDNEFEDITNIARETCDFTRHFVGSNLFDGYRKECFSLNDVNTLIARRDFEMMIPKDLPQELLDESSVAEIMRYFYYGLWLLSRVDDSDTKHVMERAFYDTLGGFLNHYLLPVVKFSYYASKVELRTVRNVLSLYHKCCLFLNTNGNGWRSPLRDPTVEFKELRITPLNLKDERGASSEDKRFCQDLDLSSASSGTEIVDDNMIVALPKLELEDQEGYLSNIWLPFSRKRTFNLRSCKSAFVFLRFYRSVSSCYEQKHLERKTFDHKFRQWIVENIKIHLGDEVFYPGLGGILNVYENLRGIGVKCVNKTMANKQRTKKSALRDDEKNESESVIEGKSCEYANIIEGPNLGPKKRAIADEHLQYLKYIEENKPMDPEEKGINDWIEAFDDSTFKEYTGPKGKKLKCKKKCRRKKLPQSGPPAEPRPYQLTTLKPPTILQILPMSKTTTPDLIKTTTPRLTLPIKTTTEKPTKKPTNSKTSKFSSTTTSGLNDNSTNSELDELDEAQNKYWFFFGLGIFLILLIMSLCLLCIFWCLKPRSEQEKEEEKKDDKPKKVVSKTRLTPSRGSSSSPTRTPKKSVSKSNKEKNKSNKKSDKTDKKSKKTEKTKEPKEAKKREKPPKEKKSPKEVNAKKDLKMRKERKPVYGMLTNPSRSHQKRGGRLHSRSPSP